MNYKSVFLFLLGVMSFASHAQRPDSKSVEKDSRARLFQYTNPITRDTAISMRDHCIIKVEKLWYCVGTSNPVWTGKNPGVRMLVSEDLIHWKQHS